MDSWGHDLRRADVYFCIKHGVVIGMIAILVLLISQKLF
jgi:hypothetical protein